MSEETQVKALTNIAIGPGVQAKEHGEIAIGPWSFYADGSIAGPGLLRMQVAELKEVCQEVRAITCLALVSTRKQPVGLLTEMLTVDELKQLMAMIHVALSKNEDKK